MALPDQKLEALRQRFPVFRTGGLKHKAETASIALVEQGRFFTPDTLRKSLTRQTLADRKLNLPTGFRQSVVLHDTHHHFEWRDVVLALINLIGITLFVALLAAGLVAAL